jgi:hypothetical protein
VEADATGEDHQSEENQDQADAVAKAHRVTGDGQAWCSAEKGKSR